MKKLTEAWLKAAKDDLDVIERIVKDYYLSPFSTEVTQAAKRGETLLAAERDLAKTLGDIEKL
jgi:hypothetical protein